MFKREYLLPFCMVLAVVVYVVLPVFFKEYKPDPALAGILTGLIGLAAGAGGKKEKDDEKKKDDAQ